MRKVEHRETPSAAFDYPIGGSDDEKFRFALDFAVLAPSGHNSQPWLFAIHDASLELFADRTRALPVVDPEDRELVISCGAALHHLRVTLRNFGHNTTVEPFPDPDNPDLLARVTIGDPVLPGGTEHALFRTIPRRRTSRAAFEDKGVPDDTIVELVEAAEDEGAWLHIVADETMRNTVADLIAEGDKQQAANKHFRRELAAWLHGNRARTRDGIPGHSLGAGAFQSAAMPFLVRTFDWGDRQAAKDRQIAQGSPLLVVLGTNTNTREAWLAAGQSLSNVLLHAAAQDIAASFLNQPIEVPRLRTKLAALLQCDGYPQLLLRMGYAREDKFEPTPRRTVDEVLL